MRATPRPPQLAALVVLLATAVATTRAGAPGPSEDAATRRLQRAVGQLRQEHRLASGRGFYLRLDAARQRLALMLQGVALDEYPVARIEWGVPQVLFVERRLPSDWDLVGFSLGKLEPARGRDRIEVVAPAPAASAATASDPSGAASPSPPAVPKSAEEAYSVPSPYRIVFAEGVSLELRAEGPAGRNRGLGQRLVDRVRLRLSDLATALGLGARERVRLRLTLEAEHAASLYRSLPPDVGLIVVGLAPR